MITLKHKIKAQNGMHARPAGALATLAKNFSSDIEVKKGEKEADGKRLLSLMSLGAVFGDELEITINGSDEKEAGDKIGKFLIESL